jgi:hypothetical protein
LKMQKAKYLFALIPVLLAVLLTSPTFAWSFSVSPSEVEIDNLSPGNKAEFELSIHNKESINHVFYLSTYIPDKADTRKGRVILPDNSWISFPNRVEVPANSEKELTIEVAIPQNQEWEGNDWEIWLGITPESVQLIVVNYYVRLLLSTGENVNAGSRLKPILIIVTIVLLLYGSYSFYHKANSSLIR